jgi:cobalt/nickel transport system permease protein
VLVGPWAAVVCLAVVLVVQSLLFADGGLTALGLNITWAMVAVFGGWGVFLLLRRALPATKASVVVASGIAAGISVVLAASTFVLMYAIGGTGNIPVGTVFAAMVGVHTLIGIGEGIITALTVGVVLGVRPDLVYGAQDLQAPLTLGARTEPAAGEVS